MWTMIMTTMAVMAVALAARLAARVRGTRVFARVREKHRILSWPLAMLPVAAVGLTFALCVNVTTAFVVLLHLLVIWELSALLVRLAARAARRPYSRDVAAIVGISLTVVCLGAGWYMAHHVFRTDYRLVTDEIPAGERLRIVEIADAHLGITLDGERFARQMERVQALEPDAVLIVGDFVDDDTSAADMREGCAALGRLKTRCGVYFSYGNHDMGYFRYRNFSAGELLAALEQNGVTVLADEAVRAGDDLWIVGRRDRTMHDRSSPSELMAGVDGEGYTVMMDHQPNDYAAEAAAGPDLVLSGHTHGGHIWPAGLIGLAMGANDRVYGIETRGDTTFIVTSGISGWAIPFKTGTFSEFVVIDVVGA